MENYHVCCVAIAPIRKESSDRSEIVSQLLFGDRVEVLERTDKWCFIVTKHDNYQGWIDPKQLEKISKIQYFDDLGYDYMCSLHVATTLKAENGSDYYLCAGSTLPYYNNGTCYLGEKKFEVLSEAIKANHSSFYDNILKTAKFFENAPYLWGGRSLFGIDCSGFVQLVYKLNGISIKRDASQQVEAGELVAFLAEAKLGDLAFFENENGNITHVGLMLSNEQIIHASGKVRIDPIDDQGIYNADLGKYTHKLRVIKRMV